MVIQESDRRYGITCLRGITFLIKNVSPAILIFLDGDYIDYPEDRFQLIDKINEGYDFVFGFRPIKRNFLRSPY